MGYPARPIPPVAELQALIDAGKGRLAIAQHYGTSKTTVARWLNPLGLHTHGVYIQPRAPDRSAEIIALRDQGLSKRQIMRRVHCHLSVVTAAYERFPTRRTRPSTAAFSAANPFGIKHVSQFDDRQSVSQR